jgi:hypothetical protein
MVASDDASDIPEGLVLCDRLFIGHADERQHEYAVTFGVEVEAEHFAASVGAEWEPSVADILVHLTTYQTILDRLLVPNDEVAELLAKIAFPSIVSLDELNVRWRKQGFLLGVEVWHLSSCGSGVNLTTIGTERVILTHPERVILTHPGRQDGRSGQER